MTIEINASETVIAELNEYAEGCLGTSQASTALEAIECAAAHFELELIHEADEEDTRLYRLPSGEYVNAWIESDQLGDGESGFDDQTDWAKRYMESNLTDNLWTERIGELRQMVADVSVAPLGMADVEYLINEWDLYADEAAFARRELIEKHNLA
jgi:hypothetical protein